MDQLKKILKSYEAWVAKNPDMVSDFEMSAKCVSYFIAGRISDSNIVSEMIYSLSNMLVLYNDRIIDKSRQEATPIEISTSDSFRFCERLKVMLTTLEYSEVFLEVSAKRVFGTKGKWIIIAMIQFVKAAGRLFILKQSSKQIITSPTIPALNRRLLIKQQEANAGVLPKINENIEPSFTFRLKRSGRLIRKVEGAPPIQCRSFKLNAEVEETNKLNIPRKLLQAEYLYIAKPLIHLAAMGIFGEKRWKQYVVSLSVDLISIHLYRRNRILMSKQQKLELSKRCINLLLYLMRTPFYDRFTKSRLERALDLVTDHVPLVKLISGPLREYIPHWQSTYFYLWST